MYPIIISLLFIAIYVVLLYVLSYAEATLDHFKINGNANPPPSAFMHKNYILRNIAILGLVSIAAFHAIPYFFKWYYYFATIMTCILFYIPLHDGWYYKVRNKWKAGSYKGFWSGVDSHPSSPLAKALNEPTMRWLLFALALMFVIFIASYDVFR